MTPSDPFRQIFRSFVSVNFCKQNARVGCQCFSFYFAKWFTDSLGQLSVTDERMCTKYWLTTEPAHLDMTKVVDYSDVCNLGPNIGPKV